MRRSLDKLARIAAAQVEPGSRAGYKPLTRADVVKRGFVGTLAMGSLGHLAFPARSSGAGCPGGSLHGCLDRAENLYRDALVDCDDEADPGRKLVCYRNVHGSDRKHLRNVCRKYCAASKPKPPGGPRPSPKKPAHPPPLPPNPYDDLARQCANCASVGGLCCYGGKDPRSLCACANASVGCKRYGCSG
jgi:hypothetical protein